MSLEPLPGGKNRGKVLLLPGERLDALGPDGGLKIVQHPKLFRFSLDAYLLAAYARPRRGETVLELGSGNGAVLLLLAARTEAARVVGVEIQPILVEMAWRSILLNGLAGRIALYRGDFRQEKAVAEGPFDLVVANPPHIPAGGGTRSPAGVLAVARHELTCTLWEVVAAAARWVRDGGRFIMVHRAIRLTEIMATLTTWRFTPKRLTMVHPRPEAPASLLLVEACHGARPGLMVTPPLFVRDRSGTFTPAMEEVFGGRWSMNW
ncbi:MAG: tRNA1(Val) (adenine(37)-N6)-methyltransferase [Firmicutes bacterium]|nr:tRNA1(Val) (adenine(37)-N6)-methyltransferase [Bacillota bacterium]